LSGECPDGARPAKSIPDVIGDAGPAPDQSIATTHASRIAQWVAGAVSVLAAAVFLVIGATRIGDLLFLPNCDDETTREALAQILGDKTIKLNRLSDIRSISSSRSERICSARADVTDGFLNLDYRIDWSGWNQSVTLTEMVAEARIDPARLSQIRDAADDFLSLAKDAHVTGRPPRQTDPAVRALLDKVFDLASIEGTTLTASDITKANEWFTAGDRIGTVYILAGTGASDITRLSTDRNVQQRTHRNVAAFAPEFARYLDFQAKLATIMADAELNRAAKADEDLDHPAVKREFAEVRATLAESLTGDLTTLAYDGLNDEWRRQRLAVLMQVAPKAAKFLSPEQAQALREHALTVATFVREKPIQDTVRAFADVVASP